MPAKDLHGKAILDYYHGNQDATLLIHTSYGEPEEMPVEVFFREEPDFSVLENVALLECQGKVLDLGAGAGAHSLVLQERGFDIHAIENSPGCIEVMNLLGIKNIIAQDFWIHHEKYDTLLVLMNGLGLAGRLSSVPEFLEKCMAMLNPGGQLLIDSSDIAYLYKEGVLKPDHYYGEVQYQYEYLGAKGNWFDWVYVDQETIKKVTSELGLKMEILHIETTDQYLMRVTSTT